MAEHIITQEEIEIEKYIQDSMNLLSFLADMVNTWGADNDEMNTYETREKYSKFMINVKGYLNKKSYVGKSIFSSLNNLACLAQKVSSKHADIRISKIVKKDVIDSAKEYFEEDYSEYAEAVNAMAANKVNASYAIEVSFQDLNYVQHTAYKTVAEYFGFFLKFLFREERYTLNTLNAISADFPDTSGYSSAEFMGYKYYMAAYKSVYDIFFKRVLSRIDSDDFLREIHGLIQKYPVVYDDKYEKIFIRDTKHYGPYIEFEYFNLNEKESSIGYASVSNYESYSTTKILVKFKVNMRKYTPKFIIIENYYMDVSTCNHYEYVDIEWGEWVGDNAAELIIHKNENEVLGDVKIKIIIEENPNIMGYIKFY